MGSGKHWGAQAQSKGNAECFDLGFYCLREISAWHVVPVVHCTSFVGPYTLQGSCVSASHGWLCRLALSNVVALMSSIARPFLFFSRYLPHLDGYIGDFSNFKKNLQRIQFFKCPLRTTGNPSFHIFM